MEALYANSYRKIKSRKKSPSVKKTKQNKKKKRPERRKKELHFVKERKQILPKATKALGLAIRLRKSRDLLKIRSVRISLEKVA